MSCQLRQFIQDWIIAAPTENSLFPKCWALQRGLQRNWDGCLVNNNSHWPDHTFPSDAVSESTSGSGSGGWFHGDRERDSHSDRPARSLHPSATPLYYVLTAVISVSACLFFERHVCKGARVHSHPKIGHTDVSLYGERRCMSEHRSRKTLLFLHDEENAMLWNKREASVDNCLTPLHPERAIFPERQRRAEHRGIHYAVHGHRGITDTPLKIALERGRRWHRWFRVANETVFT